MLGLGKIKKSAEFQNKFQERLKAKMLNFKQKESRMEVAQESLNEANNYTELLKR